MKKLVSLLFLSLLVFGGVFTAKAKPVHRQYISAVILGNVGVNKTQLIRGMEKYVQGTLDDAFFKPDTSGHIHNIPIGHLCKLDNVFDLSFSDSAGHKVYREILVEYLRNKDIAAVMIDFSQYPQNTTRDAMDAAEQDVLEWLEFIDGASIVMHNDYKKVLVGDCSACSKISDSDYLLMLQQFQKKYKFDDSLLKIDCSNNCAIDLLTKCVELGEDIIQQEIQIEQEKECQKEPEENQKYCLLI